MGSQEPPNKAFLALGRLGSSIKAYLSPVNLTALSLPVPAKIYLERNLISRYNRGRWYTDTCTFMP